MSSSDAETCFMSVLQDTFKLRSKTVKGDVQEVTRQSFTAPGYAQRMRSVWWKDTICSLENNVAFHHLAHDASHGPDVHCEGADMGHGLQIKGHTGSRQTNRRTDLPTLAQQEERQFEKKTHK